MNRFKVKGYTKIFLANSNQQRAGEAILVADKIDFVSKTLIRDKSGLDGCGSVGWALPHRSRGHQFNSQSGHAPGLQPGPWLGACEGQPMDVSLEHLCCPLSLPPFPFL